MTGADAAHEPYLMALGAKRREWQHGDCGDVRRVVCAVALSYDPPRLFEGAGQGGIEGSSLRADLVGNGGDRSW